jgi:site-specific DNA-methyltransferase (adenine-specific)
MQTELVLADCLQRLRDMETASVDLLLTDPPYGIGHAVTRGANSIFRYFVPKAWDVQIPAKTAFEEMLRVGNRHIIWGGNYFAHILPPSNAWFVWHKNDGLPSLQFSDCELAWTSCVTKSKVFNCRHRGGLKDSKETLVAHPTQKALEVIKWCLELGSKPGDLVLDPFMGSGTTGVACVLMGRRFIGIERDPEYFNMAKRRIALAKLGQL